MKVKLNIPNPKPLNYKVKGKTYDEARDFLTSKPYSACYEANPTFSYKYNDAGDCHEITVKASPTITMPKWDGASKLKGDEKKWWNSMMTALAKHEAEHHKIFSDDAKQFKKDTEASGDFPKADVATTMSDFFQASQDNQDKFDSKTDHGAKKGVVLP